MKRNLSMALKQPKYNPADDSLEMCLFDAYIDPRNVNMSTCDKAGMSKTFNGLIKIRSTAQKLFSYSKGEAFLKAFPAKFASDPNEIGLALEIIMLRYLNTLDAYRVTPCIPKYYMDFSCKGYSGITGKAFRRSATCLEADSVNVDEPMVYALSEAIRGQSFFEWLAYFSGKTVEDFKHVLFQLLYTCHEFHLAKVRHNDLHGANVIIKPIHPTDMFFVVGEKIVKLEKCRFLAKIIDYDRASFYELKSCDFIQDLCEDYGQCFYGANPKKDAVTVMSTIAHYLQRGSSAEDFFIRFCMKMSSDPENMIIKPLSKYRASNMAHLCFQPNFDFRTEKDAPVVCKNWVPSDSLFKPFLLSLPFFGLEMEPLTREALQAISKEDTYISLSVDHSFYEVFNSSRGPESEIPPLQEGQRKSVIENLLKYFRLV